MSKIDGLVTVGGVCVLAGAALLLMGTSGPGLTAAAVTLSVGAIALAGAIVLRRRQPRTPSAVPDVRAAGPSRTARIAVVVDAVLGGVAVLLTFTVAQGEARGHGVLHLLFGTVVLALFVAMDRWWRPSEGTAAASFRTPLLVLLWVAMASAFLESIGAAGYDRFNAGDRIAWLTSVHGFATPLGSLSLLIIPIALAVLASVVVGRLRAAMAPR